MSITDLMSDAIDFVEDAHADDLKQTITVVKTGDSVVGLLSGVSLRDASEDSFVFEESDGLFTTKTSRFTNGVPAVRDAVKHGTVVYYVTEVDTTRHAVTILRLQRET
jgi:hypothetical protein